MLRSCGLYECGRCEIKKILVSTKKNRSPTTDSSIALAAGLYPVVNAPQRNKTLVEWTRARQSSQWTKVGYTQLAVLPYTGSRTECRSGPEQLPIIIMGRSVGQSIDVTFLGEFNEKQKLFPHIRHACRQAGRQGIDQPEPETIITSSSYAIDHGVWKNYVLQGRYELYSGWAGQGR